MARNTICGSIRAPLFSIACANTCISPDRKRDAITASAVHEGEEITTIEGVGQPENLHPVQAAFVASDAYQCGYCTSGQLMSAVALLNEPCGPEDSDVKE